MDEHPKAKGDKSTLAVMLALHKLGLPFCKTGRLRNGAVLFATCSCYGYEIAQVSVAS